MALIKNQFGLYGNMKRTKTELRQEVRNLNKQYLSPDYHAKASMVICKKIQELSQFVDARRVALYHALPDEPSLQGLLEEFAKEKELYLPRVDGQDIAFFYYKGEEGLSVGSYGIEEPEDSAGKAVDPHTLDLIIVPGMAFSPEGIRLGRGKAYYDRFLPYTNAYLVGVTFAYRLFPEIPHEEWDFPMNRVLTD
ncbi:5-formyltetrahydrofolate cyclo-ligase [Bacteroidales bacterium KA00251]|nr:5-formyltetrahydrofolate cyclo-ligase [Bacteroidales bacterium KA00251]